MGECEDILRAQAGDREAFGRLVEGFRGLVYGICYGMTGQAADAEDLAHEAFVEAFLKLRTLRDPERFAPWLRTLTLNVCRMWHRRRVRERANILPEVSEDDANGNREARLSACFPRLSDTHRMVLALHYWEGLSYEEMARVLDVPAGTVMSRMNRARQALKTAMEQSEDMAMDAECDLQTAVDAEIEVLLRLFGGDVDSMERLSLVLEKSPERFRQVVAQVEDGAGLEQVALLVRHLGPPAVEVIVGAYFDGDAQEQAKVFSVLQRLVHDQDRPQRRHVMPLLPGVYLVLDAILRSSRPAEAQVNLLIDLLEGSASDGITMVFACVLRGYGDAAFHELMARFKETGNPGERGTADGLSEVLRLFGTQFFKALLPFLRGRESRDMQLGLQGAGAAVGLLDRFLVNRDSKAERMMWQRTQGVLFSDQMDAGVLDEITRAVADLASHADREMRIGAIEVLKCVPVGGHLVTLRRCLSFPDEETQIAAMRTLAELGDRGCVRILLDAASVRDGLVLRKTLEALGHLRAPEAQPLMEELVGHPDRGIREAAILALGNVGNESARRRLRDMIGSSDKRIAQLAARALYGGDQCENKPRASALTRARLQKIRGDARPHPWLHRSVVAAMKSLPEMRVYEETDLTRRIATMCGDYSTTRRTLVSGRDRLMTRATGLYAFTPLGKAVWRVERFIQERFLDLERY